MSSKGRDSDFLRDYMQKELKGGELPDAPYWLTEEIGQLRQAGFTRGTLKLAWQGIRRLFPPAEMRRGIQGGNAVLFSLFKWMTPAALVPLLRVGMVHARYPLGREIINALRDPDMFWSATAEAEVWGNLHSLRAGLVYRIPKGGGGPRPDFALLAPWGWYFVEVKVLRTAEHEEMCRELGHNFLQAMLGLNLHAPDGIEVVCRVDQRLYPAPSGTPARIAFVQNSYPLIKKRLLEALVAAKTRFGTPGVINVGGVGTIEIASASPGKAISIQILPPLTPAGRALRAVESLAGAADQLRPYPGIHVAVLDVGAQASPDQVRGRIAERLGRTPEALSGINVAVLRMYIRNGLGPIAWHGQPLWQQSFLPAFVDRLIVDRLGR